MCKCSVLCCVKQNKRRGFHQSDRLPFQRWEPDVTPRLSRECQVTEVEPEHSRPPFSNRRRRETADRTSVMTAAVCFLSAAAFSGSLLTFTGRPGASRRHACPRVSGGWRRAGMADGEAS